MTATPTIATEAYDQLTLGLVRARNAAEARGLDPDDCVTWMTSGMMHLVRGANPDHTIFDGFHGHALRLLKGPEIAGFSAHPELA